MSSSFATPWTPGSSVRGISQARILEWVAISFSGGSFQLRDQTCISSFSRQVLYHWATKKPMNYIYSGLKKKKKIDHYTTSMLPTGYSPSQFPLKTFWNINLEIYFIKGYYWNQIEYIHVQPCTRFGHWRLDSMIGW